MLIHILYFLIYLSDVEINNQFLAREINNNYKYIQIKSDFELYRQVYLVNSKQIFVPQMWDFDNFWGFETEEQRIIRREKKQKKIFNIYLLLSVLGVSSFILIFRQSRKKITMDSNDPQLILSGKTRYRIFSYTGVVTQSSNMVSTEQTVFVSNNYVSVSNNINESERFMILDSEGLEHAVDLQNTGIRLRHGNNISAFWIASEGKTFWKYICFFNHDTRVPTYIPNTIELLLEFNPFPSIVFGALSVCIIGLFMNLAYGEVFVFLQILLSLLAFGIFFWIEWSNWKNNLNEFIDKYFHKYVIKYHERYQLAKQIDGNNKSL